MDEGRLMQFLHRFVVDFGATGAAGNVLVGEQLGLFRAMREGPLLPAELAARTETTPRYVEEWLRGQAAGGYVEYDASTGRYFLTEEQTFALTNPEGPVYLPGAFQFAAGTPSSAGSHSATRCAAYPGRKKRSHPANTSG